MQAGVLGRAAGHHLGDHAADHVVHAEGFRQGGVDVLDGDAQVAANHPAVLDQVGHHLAGDRRRGGEADALPVAVRGQNGGVDADQVATGVDQRAAGVAAVDGRVGLDEILEGGDAQMGAAGGADDAHGHGLAHAQRVADGQHHVADAHRLRAVQFDLRQVFQGDLQQRQIGFRVGAHHPRRGVPAVAQGHQDLIGVADHMVAGQHIAFGGHQHPGAQAGQGALAARALHEAVEQRVVAELLAAAGDDLGGIDVDHRRRRPGHRVRVAVRAGRRGGGRRAGVAGAGPVLVPPQHRQAHGQAGDHRQRQKSKQF